MPTRQSAPAPLAPPAQPSPERPLFYVEEGWPHIFPGGSQRDVRFVLTIRSVDDSIPVTHEIQVFVQGAWCPCSAAEADDVAESIGDNDVVESLRTWLTGAPLSEFAVFEPEQVAEHLPAWAEAR